MDRNAFKNAVESHDMEAAVAQLADDVIFRSPVVYKAYEGKEPVAWILRAVGEVFEDFGYDSQIDQGDRSVLQFHARVGEKRVEGADFLTFGEDGLISELTVMVRPMSGMLALAEAMKAKLEAAGVA
jgi:hypothetical protein